MVRKLLTVAMAISILGVLPFSAHAINVGVFGHVFSIKEQDFLVFIHQKLVSFR